VPKEEAAAAMIDFFHEVGFGLRIRLVFTGCLRSGVYGQLVQDIILSRLSFGHHCRYRR